MSSVNSVSVNTPSATQLANLMPAAAPAKRTFDSSAGVNVTTSPASRGQSIFINGKAGGVDYNANMGSTQSVGKSGSTFNAGVSANVSNKPNSNVAASLRAALNLTGSPKGVALQGVVGANISYTVPLSPSAKVSASGDVSVNTNGVVDTALTLKATQQLGSDASLSATAVAKPGAPVTFGVGADASIPLNDQLSGTLSVNQGFGGEFKATAGVGFKF